MLFRRRKPADYWERFKTALWPRRSYNRSMQYFTKRVLRLTATPHAVAAGIAGGVFASCLPYMGFHFLIAATVAFILRGNLLASVFGTAFGNPITFPLIWSGSLALGRAIMADGAQTQFNPLQLTQMLGKLEFVQLWEPFLKPMTIGGAILGVVFATLFYLVTRWTMTVVQEQRRFRLAKRARRRADTAAARI